MGVPTFYRYVHEKFPKCVRDYVEVMPDGLEAAVESDWSAEPNPNGVEFDNLYLDFNGIVHNATHPEGRPAPTTFDAMMLEVFRRVDRLVLAARPRRMLFLALDGVAPRAKMNQQRSRRFMAAREREQAQAAQKPKSAMQAACSNGEGEGDSESFDHNAITPGTEFMLRLGECLRYYCAERIARCPAWRQLTVILSDASVPGEGEHKIMAHIRAQRARADYDADSSHLVYGLDADLVMLALATHEPRFCLLRDFVPIGKLRFVTVCDACGARGHVARDCPVLLDKLARAREARGEGGEGGEGEGEAGGEGKEQVPWELVPYASLQLLDISVLREYLAHLLRRDAFVAPSSAALGRRYGGGGRGGGRGGEADDGGGGGGGDDEGDGAGGDWWDLERLLDDFVLLTFLVGNDFLPHLPCLAMRGGGLDVALDTYRRVRRSLPGYLVRAGGKLDVRCLTLFFEALAHSEERVVARRSELHATWGGGSTRGTKAKRRKSAKLAAAAHALATGSGGGQGGGGGGGGGGGKGQVTDAAGVDGPRADDDDDDDDYDDDDDDDAMDEGTIATTKATLPAAATPSPSSAPAVVASTAVGAASGTVATSAAFRAREYELTFGADLGAEGLRGACASFLQGIAWCAAYYFDGCADWRWHYDQHYAPFAYDLAAACRGGGGGGSALSAPPVQSPPWEPAAWSSAGPLLPLEQLVTVLPAHSAPLLPASFRPLLCSDDSALAPWVPQGGSVKLDMRGKKHEWQAVVLLPFIPAEVVAAESRALVASLTPSEVRRNENAPPLVFSHHQSRLASAAREAEAALPPPHSHSHSHSHRAARRVTLPWAAGGLAGGLQPFLLDDSRALQPLASLPPLQSGACASFTYTEPPPLPHRSALLPAATPVPPRLAMSEHSSVVSYSSQFCLFAKAPAAAAPAAAPLSQRVSQRGGGGKRKKRKRDGASGAGATNAAAAAPAAVAAPPVAQAGSALSCEGLFGFSF